MISCVWHVFTWVSRVNLHENVPKTHTSHVQSTCFPCAKHTLHMWNFSAESHVYVATCEIHVLFPVRERCGNQFLIYLISQYYTTPWLYTDPYWCGCRISFVNAVMEMPNSQAWWTYYAIRSVQYLGLSKIKRVAFGWSCDLKMAATMKQTTLCRIKQLFLDQGINLWNTHS